MGIKTLPASLGACVLLQACASMSAYLNGTYNSAAFPPLDAPPDDVALVSQSKVADAACVLASVDDTPILVTPSGNGDGLWAKRVALTPGAHTVLAGWRLPGRYSPDGVLCSADFAAGHQYTIDYDVSIPRQARVWIADAATGDRVADCRAQ
jgi:hypothetical protein